MHKYLSTKLSVLLCVLCVSVVNLVAQNTTRSLNIEKWQFKKSTESKWYKATVPGTIHTDLFANKLIPDPYFGDNEKQLQWIENENWEYKTSFIVSKKELANNHAELEFEGLDTYAKVYLNDSLIFIADNMFRTWNKEVKKHLLVGKNNLRIVFESAVKKGKEEATKLSYTLPGDEKVFTRKAQYQYGWDWGPRFVTCGIWKDVKLDFWSRVKIRNVNCIQKILTDTLAELTFEYDVELDGNEIFYPVVYLNNRDTNAGISCPTCNYHFEKGRKKITVDYFIKNPKRWWSNGLGEASLYNFTVAMSKKSGPIDQVTMNIGLRTIELIQEKDQFGSSFYFKLNGVPVFMKGANYIPPDNFLPRATNETYESIVAQAKDANMNMLRVWGGGVYADDVFYDECDRNGILVWQDFMFACAMYPGDEKFISNVKQEVIDNVNRLQNHPCIALWCGNNENDEGWKNWGWQKQLKYTTSDSSKIWNDYTNLFHNLIPKTLDSLSPKTIYWPSSPSIGWGRKESLLQGDSHYWGVWWGMEPFEVYNKKVGRFMSEYGFQGMPDYATLKKCMKPEDLNFDSPAFKNHQKHAKGFETINTYMERDYKIPTKLEDYIYVSQLLQARGMKTAIEAHRRAKPYCMGTLYWQLNDCWPVTSWSSVDYDGNWKAAQYAVKRLYNDIIFSVEEKHDSVYIYIINDQASYSMQEFTVCLMEMEGKTLSTHKSTMMFKANSSTLYSKFDKATFLSNTSPEKCFLNINLHDSISCNYIFVKPKELDLKKPTITCKYITDTTLEISSDVFAKDVRLTLENSTFSDNYFDLLPNQKKIVRILSKQKTDQEKQPAIKSLFDVN